MFWSVLAVLVFGLLFVSADAIVASWVDAVLPDISVDTSCCGSSSPSRSPAPTLAAAYLALNPPGPATDGVLAARGRSRTGSSGWCRCCWSTRVFAVFVAAQLSVLFGGHDYVQRTTGLTYADYVHQGSASSPSPPLLTLLVVWAASHWAGDQPPTGSGCGSRWACCAR